jgi:hypothetical protein
MLRLRKIVYTPIISKEQTVKLSPIIASPYPFPAILLNSLAHGRNGNAFSMIPVKAN